MDRTPDGGKQRRSDARSPVLPPLPMQRRGATADVGTPKPPSLPPVASTQPVPPASAGKSALPPRSVRFAASPSNRHLRKSSQDVARGHAAKLLAQAMTPGSASLRQAKRAPQLHAMVFHADGSTEFQWLRRPDILLEAVKDFVTMVFGEGAVRDALSSSSATGRGAVGRDATGAGVGADGASCTPVTSHVASSIDSDDADVTECKVPPPSLAASDATFDNLLRRHTSGSYGIPHTSPSLYRDASDDARYRRQTTRRSRRSRSYEPAPSSLEAGLLQMRDLRAVDPAFTVSNAPALLVRRNALLVNMYTIKAIILTKRCYFFLKEGADGEVLAMREWLGPDWPEDRGPKPPFEFRALEAILATVTRELDLAVDRVANRVTALVKEAHNGPTASVLKRLRTAKGAVLTLENRHIRQISKVLQEVLDNPVDLRMAYLSRVNVSDEVAAAASMADLSAYIEPLSHAEAELLLEAYLMEVDSLLVKVKQSRHDIEALERESTLMLDVARNRLHRMELWFTLITMALAFGAFIASLFGMNLQNGWEDSDGAVFMRVVAFTTALCIVITAAAGCMFRRVQLL